MVKVKCVHCGEQVSEWTTDCPKCGKPVANPDAPTNVSASPRSWKATGGQKKKNSLQYIIFGILIVIIVIAVIYFLNR
jgi:uncharacterized membrane protein YvbJ